MKKIFVMVLAACLLLCTAACAEPGAWMKVVNCEEWVSLREKPDAASECLVEVPLGAVVENCSAKTKAFTYAEYQGVSGYIMSQYLEIIPEEEYLLGDLCAAERGAWIPMRTHPDQNERVIQWLAPGAVVEACVEASNGFAYGQHNGLKGYVDLNDLYAGEVGAQDGQ